MASRSKAGGGERRMRVYLAGGFYNRQDYKTRIHGRLGEAFELWDPEEADGPQYPGWYVSEDLSAISAAGLVLAFMDEYPNVYGMAAEVGYAAGVGTPVIFVCERPRIDSFLSGLARATFSDLDTAMEFILERYS